MPIFRLLMELLRINAFSQWRCQSPFPVNIWCGATGSQGTRPFVLAEPLTSSATSVSWWMICQCC
jgi:hypothetical protein